ncbi:hypothetical protein ACIBH1_30690 [Nonomuraea sp. NPDC050663]|uniref:hypothetical protein n=1 Tax=Nonomuraea sp. NPDC050663 TaxID=3364370 RepID=UPI00378CFF65
MTSPHDPQSGYSDYQPYGAPYGRQPPPTSGHGHLPPAVQRTVENTRTQAIVALAVNFISVASCCNVFGLVGGILAWRALSKATTDLPGAKSLTKWSWIVFGTGFAIMAVVMGIAIAVDTRNGD